MKVLLFVALASGVSAFWRMPAHFKTGIGRIDPIVSPGAIADHAHVIFGGGNFGKKTEFKDLVSSKCTSAGVMEDKSAYWTPALYFQHDDGTTELVDTVGGMLAYYNLFLDNLTAFPEGFQMMAGNPKARYFPGPFPDTELSSWPTDPDPNNQTFLEQRALGFNCLNYAKAPEPSLYRHQFPSKAYMDANCIDGLRLEMAFPSCGNGALDSDDHKSHVKYPSLVKEGNCPAGFDVHYPEIFFETIYNTHKFAGVKGQFVLSTGDPVGTSYHGDFIMGWDSADFLQKAINTCTSGSGKVEDCPVFTLQSDADASKCTFDMPEDMKNDDYTGPRDGLPINVPIQYGPQAATKYAVAGLDNVPTTSVPHTSTPSTFVLPTQTYTSDSSVASFSSATSVPDVGASVSHGFGPGDNKPQGSHSAPGHGLNMVTSPETSPAASTNSISTAQSAAITSAAASANSPGKVIHTSYITSGSKVLEMVYEEVSVTVTATEAVTVTDSEVVATATTTQAAPVAHKRHMNAHKHRRNI